MRRIYKIIAGMLIVGVLVTGIGSGVAFAEYSTFEYGGEAFLEDSEYFIKTVEYKVPEEEDSINISSEYHLSLVEDEDIPKDMMKFVIHYVSDDKDVVPEIVQMQDEDKKDIYLNCDYQYNDFRNMMRMKDPILKDLKAHKISDYQYDGVKSVELHVNPEADFEVNPD